MTRPFKAPKTAFNDAVTGHRHVAYAQLDLEDLKTVKNRFGVKLNDVVMALCAGVLRQFLNDRGELPEQPLVAMVPVSVREKSDRAAGATRCLASFPGWRPISPIRPSG